MRRDLGAQLVGASDRDSSREREAGLLIQVLEAQINQVRAEAAQIEAIADFNRAQFGLRHAEGSIGSGVEAVD